MPHILLVNELPNKLVGMVRRIETFNKNLAKMRCEKEVTEALNRLTEDGEGTLIFKIVGRYFCMIEVNYKEALRKMIFVDYQKRNDIAMAAFSKTHKPTDKNVEEISERFFEAYTYYKELYDEHFDDVELEIDKESLN